MKRLRLLFVTGTVHAYSLESAESYTELAAWRIFETSSYMCAALAVATGAGGTTSLDGDCALAMASRRCFRTKYAMMAAMNRTPSSEQTIETITVSKGALFSDETFVPTTPPANVDSPLRAIVEFNNTVDASVRADVSLDNIAPVCCALAATTSNGGADDVGSTRDTLEESTVEPTVEPMGAALSVLAEIVVEGVVDC